MRIEAILDERGFTGIVDGTDAQPGKGATVDELEKWKKKNRLAFNQMMLTISESELHHILNMDSAAEAWKKLKLVYQPKGLGKTIYLRKKLFTAKFNTGDSMKEHIKSITETVNQLRSIGSQIEDLDVALVLLSSLPDSFDPLVVSLETFASSQTLTSDAVINRLLDEERRRDEVKSNSSGVESALISTSAFKPVGNANNSAGGNARNCTHCGKLGHTVKQCFEIVGYPENYRYKSGKRGNSGKSPPSTRGEGSTALLASTPVIVDTDADYASIPSHALVAEVKHNNNNDDALHFFLDSGASAHMIKHNNYWKDCASIAPHPIILGNKNTIHATERGNVLVEISSGSEKSRSFILSGVLYSPDLGFNLLSIPKMASLGITIEFKGDQATLKSKGVVIGIAKQSRTIFIALL